MISFSQATTANQNEEVRVLLIVDSLAKPVSAILLPRKFDFGHECLFMGAVCMIDALGHTMEQKDRHLALLTVIQSEGQCKRIVEEERLHWYPPDKGAYYSQELRAYGEKLMEIGTGPSLVQLKVDFPLMKLASNYTFDIWIKGGYIYYIPKAVI